MTNDVYTHGCLVNAPSVCCIFKCHVHVPLVEARLFVTTGAPVQPHSSEGLEGLPINFRWVMVPPVIFEHVGFVADANSLAGFCEQFDLEVPEDLRFSHHTAVRSCHTIQFCFCVCDHHMSYAFYVHTHRCVCRMVSDGCPVVEYTNP